MKQVETGQRSTASQRRRYLRLTAGVTLVFVTVVFGGLEIGVRIWQSRRFGPQSMRSIALRDRFTAWRNNPAYGRLDRRINEQGFRRDRNVSVEKPPNTVRVFLTGGSVAYGWTTGWPQIDNRFDRLYDNQTISYYLEEMLNESFPSKHWEVINAAVVGYQLNLELAQTQSILLRYKPDFIVYLDGHNDLWSLLRNPESYDPYVSTPTAAEFDLLANPGSSRSLFFFAFVWMRENSAFVRAFADRVQPTEQPPGERRAGAPRLAGKIQLSDLSPKEQLVFAAARDQLAFYPRLARQINSIVRLDGAKPVFLLQPELLLTAKTPTPTEQRLLDFQRQSPTFLLYGFQELYPEIASRMTVAASESGFTFQNLTDVFDQTSEQTFTDDCHLTPDGNRLVAARVSQLLGNMAQ